MSDKPNLTLAQVFKEFPKECKAVLDGYWKVERDIDFWRDKAECETGVFLDYLTTSALRWLAGKDVVNCPVRCGFLYFGHRWPNDMLRVLLEEVREQLKQEKEDE